MAAFVLEGVDYSRGGFPGSDALNEAGKRFVVRYVVSDLSPEGRGVTAEEYQELRSGGIDVVAVWEGAANRITAGYAAGQADARDAQSNVERAGLPLNIPVYFACDFDATSPTEFNAIDAYLKGAATIIGTERVGVYGGYWVIDHCHANGSAKWFWQTSAWSGNKIHPENHLYQYRYNHWINGVNCDDTQGVKENYGQASVAEHVPSIYPEGMDLELAKLWFGEFVVWKDGKDHSYHFDPEGPVSKLWLEHGKKAEKFPKILSVYSYDTRTYIEFVDGWRVWQPNKNAKWRVLK